MKVVIPKVHERSYERAGQGGDEAATAVAETHGQPSPLLALPVWPVITAIPAFLVALAVAAVLARFSRHA